jgi:hypothetical protein
MVTLRITILVVDDIRSAIDAGNATYVVCRMTYGDIPTDRSNP